MSLERSMRQFEEDRKEAVEIAARLLLVSATTTPRVGGVGECTTHILEDECDIEDLCQQIEKMSEENTAWDFFKRDAVILRDADAVLIVTSLRSLTDPADINCNMCGKLTCRISARGAKTTAGTGRCIYWTPLLPSERTIYPTR